MEYGHTRKILECAVDEVEIIARPTYTRVGVKTGENRIAVSLCPSRDCWHTHCNGKEKSPKYNHKCETIC